MTKRDRELICESVLKRWRKLQDEVWAAEEDAANVAFSQGSGEPVQSSTISDKTFRGAMMLQSVDEKRKWVECVKEALEWLEHEQPELKKLLYGHYWMWNKHGYKRNHARMFADYFCMENHVSIREYHRMRVDAIDEVVFTATEKGLFNAALNSKKL